MDPSEPRIARVEDELWSAMKESWIARRQNIWMSSWLMISGAGDRVVRSSPPLLYLDSHSCKIPIAMCTCWTASWRLPFQASKQTMRRQVSRVVLRSI